jgi:hypothetical protein
MRTDVMRQRSRTLGTTSGRADAELFLELRRRLTDRDRAIFQLVWEHRVLTSHQLAAMFFTTPNKARDRLLELFRLRSLERFQPWAPVGAAPFHWVIGPLGAQVLAAQRGIDLAELGYRRTSTLRICHSAHLAHQVGVNEFFTRLRAHARRTPGATLDEWWSERRCAKLWGDLAHPDAFGRWTSPSPDGTPPATVDFFLEHDTGSVTLAKVAAKLSGYEALAEATGIATPVLFWLPNSRREINLRKQLGNPAVPVATAVHTTTPDGPAGAVWLPTGTTGPRRHLANLSDAWPTPPTPRTPDRPAAARDAW